MVTKVSRNKRNKVPLGVCKRFMGVSVLQTFVVVLKLVSRLELFGVCIQSDVFNAKPKVLFDVSCYDLDCIGIHSRNP